jgi:hypothetical protein
MQRSGRISLQAAWNCVVFGLQNFLLTKKSRQKQPSLDLVGALDSPRIENMNVYKMELGTAVLKVINDFMHCTIGNYSSA